MSNPLSGVGVGDESGLVQAVKASRVATANSAGPRLRVESVMAPIILGQSFRGEPLLAQRLQGERRFTRVRATVGPGSTLTV